MNGWKASNRVSSSYLLLFIISFFVHPCPLLCFVLTALNRKDQGWKLKLLDTMVLSVKKRRWKWPLVTEWNDRGAPAGVWDGGKQLSVSVLRVRVRAIPGAIKAEKHETSPSYGTSADCQGSNSAGCYAPVQTNTAKGVGSSWLKLRGISDHTLIKNGQRPVSGLTSRGDVLSVWHQIKWVSSLTLDPIDLPVFPAWKAKNDCRRSSKWNFSIQTSTFALRRYIFSCISIVCGLCVLDTDWDTHTHTHIQPFDLKINMPAFAKLASSWESLSLVHTDHSSSEPTSLEIWAQESPPERWMLNL